MNSHERRVQLRSDRRAGIAIRPWLMPGGRPQALKPKKPGQAKTLQLGDTAVLSKTVKPGITGVIVLGLERVYYHVDKEGAVTQKALNAATRAPVEEMVAKSWSTGVLRGQSAVLAHHLCAQQPRAAA